MRLPNFARTVAVALIALALVACASGGPVRPVGDDGGTLPSLTVCDLLRNPVAYDGRRLRLSGTYALGLGIGPSILDPSCLGGSRIWVEFDAEFTSRTDLRLQQRISRMNARPGFRSGQPGVTQVVPLVQAARAVLDGRFSASNPDRQARLDAGEPVILGTKAAFEHVFEVSCVRRLHRPRTHIP